MSVLRSKDNKELIVTCKCGCEDGIHIKIVEDSDEFSYLTYTNGNFYREQYGVFGTLKNKMNKILAIIRNKDHYYSDIILTKEDFAQFKEYVNQFGE